MIKKMPEKYKGKILSKTNYTKTAPRKWTEKEIEWCKKLKKKGYSYEEIAKSVDRTETSVSIKFKRLYKTNNSYNKTHVKDKYNINKKFIELIDPKSLLDLYAGYEFYKKFNLKTYITNDKDTKFNTDFNMDALKLLCYQYYKGNKYDIIDLDPYGSAFDCFDLSIKMAKKGLIITFGEMGHKRFKRLTYVSRYYNINKMKDFTTDNLINKVKEIGKRNKKTLKVIYKKEWKLISRVYFKIKRYKVI